MKKLLICAVILFLVNTSVIVLSNTTIQNQSYTQKPIWDIDDTWIYDMDLLLSIEDESSDISVGLSMNRLECVVTSVSTSYSVQMSSPVSGSFSIDVEGAPKISGSLQNTNFNGYLKIGPNSLSFERFEMDINGKVKVNFIPITLDIHLIATSDTPLSFLEFPLEVGNIWNSSETLIDLVGTLDLPGIANLIPGLPDQFEIDNTLITDANDFECIQYENMSTRAGIYPTYEIAFGDNSHLFYSPVIGNIIDIIPSGDLFGNIEYDLSFSLISSSYEMDGAPEKPERPIGPTKGKPNEQQTFSATAIDPEGDQIYYSFDWGEGTLSHWIGPFDSGETVTVNKTWNEKGTYQVKVKAKDIEGHESVWSNPLSVQMPKESMLYDYIIRFLENHPLLHHIITILFSWMAVS